MERHTLVPLHTHTGHNTELTFPPVQFPLWGSGDQNLFSPLIRFNKAWRKEDLSAHRGRDYLSQGGNTGLDEDACWLIGINGSESSSTGAWEGGKGSKCCVFLTDYPSVQLITVAQSFLRFSAVLFSVSLLVYLPKCREWNLTFFSIFAMLLGGDVVHNSRFSHLVYSLTPFSLFFLSHSVLLPLLPAVNDWSGTDRPPLRSVLLQRCPLSCFSFFLSLCRLPPSTYLLASRSVSVSINHFTICIIPERWFCLVLIGCQGVWETEVPSLPTVHFSLPGAM